MERFNSCYDSSEKQWHGPKILPIHHPKASLGQILIDSLSKNLKGVAEIFHDDDSAMTNEELLQFTVRCALNLTALGLKEGDVIGVTTHNEKYLTPLILAAFTIGTPVNNVNPMYKQEDIRHMFSLTRPVVVFCVPENFPIVKSVLKEIQLESPIYVMSDTVDNAALWRSALELFKPHPNENAFVAPYLQDASTPAVIACSSGTTGPAKGIKLTHSLMAYQCISFTSKYGERFFTFSTLSWLTGFLGLLSSLLNNKTRIVTRKTFTPQLMLEIIKKHQVNCLFSPPSHLAMILAQEHEMKSVDLDSVHEWMIGGSFVAKELCLRMNEYLKNGRVYNSYGSSEIAGLITRSGENYESVGRLSMGLSLKIVGDGESLGPNERGEICIRCVVPATCGYFNNQEATNVMFMDDWWHSGDLGFVDTNGDLHVVDRMRDILKFMGHRVEPTELETLIQTLPGVAMVAVIGISHPVQNDLPAAVIIKSRSAPGSLDEKMVEKLVENSLSNHKWLRGGVHFVDKMPMTASGKVLKRQLKVEIEKKIKNN